MGFEIPLALLGALGAVIPIAAHLLKSRDLPTVALPTIVLLRRVQSQSRQRRRLVDLALLVVRVLLVAALAAGAGSPFYNVRLAFGDGQVASIAIVLDDSFSMHQRVDGEQAFTLARDRALEVVEALPTGAEVTLVLAGEPARVVLSRSQDLLAVTTALSDATVSARGGDLPRAVQLATRELAGARHERRHLVVLSDLSEHNSLEEVRLPPSGADTDVETFGGGSAPNAAITGVEIIPDLSREGGLKLAVEVHAFGPLDGDPALSLTRGGETLDREAVDLSGGHVTVELRVPVVGSTELGELNLTGIGDSIPEDDRRTVLLRPPPALKVLLVDGDPDPMRDRDEMGFVARALDLAPEAEVPLDYRTVDADAFDSERLDRIDVVVMANVAATPSRSWERLKQYVRDGGGLWIAPGDRFRAAAYSSQLGELLPVRLRPAASAAPPLTVQTGLESTLMPDDDHGLGGATVDRRILLEETSSGSRVELILSDSSPLLVVGSFGAGQVAFLGTTLDSDWSDLPIRPGFLPLVVRLITSLANRPPPLSGPVRAASPVRVPLPRTATEAELIDPNGQTFSIDPSRPDFEETATMGPHRLRVATQASSYEDYADGSFVVWPPVEESDLTTGDLGEGDALPGNGASESGTWIRRSLAPWLFLFAGLLLVADAFLRARRGAARPQSSAASDR